MNIQTIVSIVGIPSIFAMLIYSGRKLQVIDQLEKKFDGFEKKFENLFERFIKTEEKVDMLWRNKAAPASSPRQLNEYGRKILAQSGIKEIIDQKRAKLLVLLKGKGLTNAYDAEQEVFSLVEKLPEYDPALIDILKTGAYNMGTNVDMLLFVGGIYFRDLVFPELGFNVDGVDRK